MASAWSIRRGIANRAQAKRRRAGFTLAELMITILIIGILSAVTAPKMMDTMDHLQLEAAAKHVAADLRYARQLAKTKGANQSVTFTPGTDTYQLDGADDIDRPGEAFIIVLPDLQYPAEMDSASFGMGSVITFNLYGQPDNGGTVVVSKDGVTKTVQVDATTGEVSIL